MWKGERKRERKMRERERGQKRKMKGERREKDRERSEKTGDILCTYYVLCNNCPI
jgi:hypothetical protein